MAICKICGKEFVAESNAQKICSPECRKKANTLRCQKYREQTKLINYCEVCGKPLPPRCAKYCSPICRNIANGRGKKIAKKRITNNYDNANGLSIEDMAKLSRKHGMSYGELMRAFYRGEVLA